MKILKFLLTSLFVIMFTTLNVFSENTEVKEDYLFSSYHSTYGFDTIAKDIQQKNYKSAESLLNFNTTTLYLFMNFLHKL